MPLKFPAFETKTVREPAFRCADDMAIAAWTKLVCQASDYENGGRFEGASTWEDRHWLPIANVTKAAVDAAVAANLCHWERDTLVVHGYDRGAEKAVNAMRKGGKFGHLGGRPRKTPGVSAAKPKGMADRNPITSPSPTLPLSTDPPESREPGSAGSPPPTADGTVLLEFPVVGDARRLTWRFGTAEVSLLRQAFPTLDVLGEAKQALLYVQANPGKRKTARGMMEYLRRWLARVQDRGGGSLVPVPGGARGAPAPKPAPESFSARDAREREEQALARVRAENTERELQQAAASLPHPRDEYVARKGAQGAVK
jgi:hypothetical protein